MNQPILNGCNREQFPALLKSKNYMVGVEIGVAQGDHAVHLMQNWPGYLMLVDYWRPQDKSVYCDNAAGWSQADHDRHYQKTIENMRPYTDRVKIIRAKSCDAAQDIPTGSLDFVYLDANHAYEPMREDLRLWFPKIMPGGMMSGHDFVDSGFPFGVRRAVTEFLEDKSVDLYVAKEEWPTWYFFKP